MSPLVSGDEAVLLKAREAIASAQTVEQLRQAQAVVLPLDYTMSLADTAQVIGVSPRWACQLRKRFYAGPDGRHSSSFRWLFDKLQLNPHHPGCALHCCDPLGHQTRGWGQGLQPQEQGSRQSPPVIGVWLLSSGYAQATLHRALLSPRYRIWAQPRRGCFAPTAASTIKQSWVSSKPRRSATSSVPG
jgi:hypothetical protein